MLSVGVSWLGVAKAQPSERVPVIVGFRDRPDPELIRSHGGEVKCVYRLIPALACSLSREAIEALKSNPRIAYVEPDLEVRAIDTELESSWGVGRIGAGIVHGYNKGTSVKVAVLDTGIDYTHPDLDANYKGGYDFVNSDADPRDDHGHGTHCAGIIAAEDNGVGVVGVAPEAWLYAVKVLDRRGSGYLSNVILGIQWSVSNGMQVLSMSLGTSTYSESLRQACDAAYQAGLVLVAAAGNSGDGNPATDEYSYPAAYDSVIAVGATDRNDRAPSWSNSGPYLELAAPGVSIYSTLPTYRVTLTATYGLSYGTLSGTSMACPHVAGTAALVIASGISSNEEVRLRLQSTADDLGPEGRDKVYGYGIVDADEAAPQGIQNLPPIANAGPDRRATVGEEITFDGSKSYDPDGTIVSYHWEFGDGSSGEGMTVTHAYSEPGSYTVTLTVTDDGGLTGSDTAIITVEEASAGRTMHVARIDMGIDSRTAGKNRFFWASATVTVVDENGNPVQDATVYGHWEGATSDSDSGITDVSGQVLLTSDQVKNPSPGTTFKFVVDNIVLSGWTYDPSKNEETSDSITI